MTAMPRTVDKAPERGSAGAADLRATLGGASPMAWRPQPSRQAGASSGPST